jgi:hypothetical protein
MPSPTGAYPYKNQLGNNSQQIKFFKYLEYYRFGIQAQHYTGKWSNPIYIADVKNTIPIDTEFTSQSDAGVPVATASISDALLSLLASAGYYKIRPVVVYPEMSDRESICQGVLCPTVYNVDDRYSNSPFVQSSWFTRPLAPFDIDKASNYKDSYYDKEDTEINDEGYPESVITSQHTRDDAYPLDSNIGESFPTIYSRHGVVSNWSTYADNEEAFLDLGSYAEFRHNKPVPSNDNRNAEIQCISNTTSVWGEFNNIKTYVSNYKENYYIDNSIVTFHSPDIEFDTNIQNWDVSGLKLRIIGIVPLTAFTSDISIETSSNTTPYNDGNDYNMYPPGFMKNISEVRNGFTANNHNSYFGWKGLISKPLWYDEVYKRKEKNTTRANYKFVVYPWHRSGSMNNCGGVGSDETRPSMLKTKRMSNLRFSYNTKYVDSFTSNTYSLSGVNIFNSNEVTALRIPEPENSSLGDLIYYGNIDKVVIPTFSINTNGYDICYEGSGDTNANYVNIEKFLDKNDLTHKYGKDPVRISYKSTPHAVLAFNYTSTHKQVVLPTFYDGDVNTKDTWAVNSASMTFSTQYFFWDKDKVCTGVSQDVYTGELYNPNVVNRFGGTTDEAIQNNKWLPCGDAVSIADVDDNGQYTLKNNISVTWDEGDTYYQRYDHLKTYAYSDDMPNSVVDIISFMCETRINIDGRYDRNRGQSSNLAISPTNFNLLNEIYSQKNNFFSYRTSVDEEEINDFGYSLTWTKTKSPGETVDTWTNVTMASTLDLDGDKGNITAIRRNNNNLLAFQPKGISQILYNENVQISSTDGVPIEIANSGKVSGKRYVSNKVGCNNKWSICETPSGLFFIDDYNKGIYLFSSEGPKNISDEFGFHSWIANKANMQSWNPIEFKSAITYYDKINKEVLFITKEECLAFSEIMGDFTSFYSYDRTPIFANIEDTGIFINVKRGDNMVNGVYKLWEQHEGDYNMYFGKYQPFSVTVIANPEATADKIFDILEFRSDTWNNDELLDTTFDTLDTWNEYQSGSIKLVDNKNKPSSVKKKFRIWRANIPRDSKHKMDRMRNPWLYVKLSMNKENINKTVLHDLTVQYFT